MGLHAMSAETLIAGIKDTFRGTYDDVKDQTSNSLLSLAMDLSPTTELRETPYGYWEAAPPMEHWRQGDPIPTGVMESVAFTVPMYDWGREISWHVNDREDDQIQGLFTSAQGAGRSAGKLPEDFFVDILTENPMRLPRVPKAPDGEGFFSATAKGSDRFDTPGGNIVTGLGVASVSAIQTNYYQAEARWADMGTGRGERLLPDEMIAGGVLIIAGNHNRQVFEEAFLQRRIGMVMGTDAGTTPSNVVHDASRNVQLWFHPRITGNHWYLILLAAPLKPVFLLTRKALTEYVVMEGMNNDPRLRRIGEEAVGYKLRQSAGLALPYAAIKVSNP